MQSKARSVLLLSVLAVGAMAVPAVLLSLAGQPLVGGLAGLGAWSAVLATIQLGPRHGILAALVTAALGAALILVSGSMALSTMLMVVVAIGFGLTARWGWNSGLVVFPITLAFTVSQAPPGSLWVAAGWLAGGITVGALAFTALTMLITRGKALMPEPKQLNWVRVCAFAVLLGLATLATTVIALTVDRGHAGGWLVMTPFIIMQPYVQDGYRKSLRRAAGTLGGFLIAIGLAELLGNSPVLAILGGVFAVLAVAAMLRRLDYSIFVLLLTPAVVILEGYGRSVQATAVARLEATLIGVALALVIMLLALPLYRRTAHENNLEHY